MTKNLSYFMRDSARHEEIICVPGPETVVDDEGRPVVFEIKVLSQKTVQDITGRYRTKSVALDADRQPYISGGEVVYQTDTDYARAARHLIVEALQYPNLKDPELMNFFNCHDITQMPLLVFPKSGEYAFVSRAVFEALGLLRPQKNNRDVEEAKN